MSFSRNSSRDFSSSESPVQVTLPSSPTSRYHRGRNNTFSPISPPPVPPDSNDSDATGPPIPPSPGTPHSRFAPSLFHIQGFVDDNRAQGDSENFKKYRKTEEELKKIKNKKVRRFYERQNEELDAFAEVDAIIDSVRDLASSSGAQVPIVPNPPRMQTGGEEEEGEEDEVSLGGRTKINGSANNRLDRDLECQPLLGSKGNDGIDENKNFCARIVRGYHRMRKTVKSTEMIIMLNLILNFVLVLGKVLAVLTSNSISLIASLVDSALDFLSTVIIWGSARIARQGGGRPSSSSNQSSSNQSKSKKVQWEWPTGKKRFEPMGVVIFSVIMITSFVQVFIESFERLISLNRDRQVATIPLAGVITMLITIGTKFVVWITCRKVNSSSVRALAQDAENDIVFNVFSLLCPWLGQKLSLNWLDPVGGLLLSLYIIIEWIQTLSENIQNLTGRRASPLTHSKVIYLVTRFSPRLIKFIQHVEVYRSGDECIVEVDLVLPEDISLPLAHNLGESVQCALEGLEGVGRAYCHIDFSEMNPSSHRDNRG